VWEPGCKERSWTGHLRTLELPQGDPALHGDPSEAAARLVQGDALEVAAELTREGLAGQVDLVYVDPPFASQAEYVHESRLDGPADGRVTRAMAYDDRWEAGGGAYLDMLAPRLEALARLLSATGTLWVHVDWRASYLVRQILDEVFGRQACINEIVWRRAPNLGRQAASHQFGRTLDTLVVYGGPAAKLVPPTRLEPVEPHAIKWDEQGRPFTSAPRGDYTDASIARLELEGRVHRTASGRVYIKYFLVKDAQSVWCRERRVDALWTDVPPLRHASPAERTGFPTQKPRALLDRIVACATPPGGLVVDVFGGSGTTGESAHALGRRFVLGDASPLSLAIARARLLRAGVPLVSQALGEPQAESGAPPRVQVARKGTGARVTLQSPQEPLAWAVGTFEGDGAPFRVLWHAERTPGSKVTPASAVATLPEATGPLAVRVWYDDGSVGTLRRAS
jgi:DNA modification methylase